MKKPIYLLTLLASVTLYSCKKDTTTPATTTTTTPSTVITVNSTPQFTGTINGVAVSMVNGTTYESSNGSGKSISGTWGGTSSAEYNSLIDNGFTNQPSFMIKKGTIKWTVAGSEPDTATFDKFFKPGSYSYSYNDTTGIEIDWVDANGNVYTTSQGTGKQTGSTFNITAERDIYSGFTGQTVAIVATLNCILYNSTGQSITLTNGTYVGSFAND